MERVHKNLCPAKISASIMAANVWKNSLNNVESDNNKILYETLFHLFYSETLLTLWISLLLFWVGTLCLINFKSQIYTFRLFSRTITWCAHTEKLQHFWNNIENAICMLHGAWILYTGLSTPLACRSLVSCYVSVGVNFMALHYSALRTVCYVL